ncbi:MAG: hypothetical protein U1E29_10135 [Coriobacteriia bacterium]|jgi:hypothetical protein|nr:hypothetical protein [Coriobacteriia bacterium]
MSDPVRTRPAEESALKRSWDFGLTVATVALLGGLGLQSFLGTAYAWWAQNTIPNWMQFGYGGYVSTMNTIAAPQILMLVVVMGLCVPKRLFSRTWLVAVSALMVLVGLAVWAFTSSLAEGLTVYLGLSALIQVAVVAMTVAGARAPSYLTEGRLTKTGSGLLHLGFIVFAIVVVALQRSTWMLPVFWVATVLTLSGTVLSFYADRFAVRRVKRDGVERTF